MLTSFLFAVGMVILLVGVGFVSGQRFERDKWALCRDCADVRSQSDLEEYDGLCRDCRRKLWGEMQG